jgi:hypothetical protein
LCCFRKDIKVKRTSTKSESSNKELKKKSAVEIYSTQGLLIYVTVLSA